MTITPASLQMRGPRSPRGHYAPGYNTPGGATFPVPLSPHENHHRVFSLTPWSARIHTRFHVSGATQDTTRLDRALNYGTITRYGHTFQSVRLAVTFHVVVLQPRQDKSRRFGLLRVRSPLLTESILFLFLRLLRCFTSPRVTLPALWIQAGVIPHYRDWVAPFGDLRIKACVPLPEAYRSLLRPSSPDDAKASTSVNSFKFQPCDHTPPRTQRL